MSDIVEAETGETKVDFEHYVTATKGIVESFRDVLAEHTAELTQAKIGNISVGASVELPAASRDPQRHAELHRIRMACDNFLAALAGQY
jgi:hypothetical protein